MEGEYHYETFSSESGEFDHSFTDFLNRKSGEDWKVKSCSYCYDAVGSKITASCIFKRKH